MTIRIRLDTGVLRKRSTLIDATSSCPIDRGAGYVPRKSGRMRLRGMRAQLCLLARRADGADAAGAGGLQLPAPDPVLHSRADVALLDYADTTARQIATSRYRIYSGADARRGPAARFLSFQRHPQLGPLHPGHRPAREFAGALRRPPESPPAGQRCRPSAQGLEGLTTFETVPGLGEHPVRIVTVPVRMGVPHPVPGPGGHLPGRRGGGAAARGWILLVLTPSVFMLSLLEAGCWWGVRSGGWTTYLYRAGHPGDRPPAPHPPRRPGRRDRAARAGVRPDDRAAGPELSAGAAVQRGRLARAEDAAHRHPRRGGSRADGRAGRRRSTADTIRSILEFVRADVRGRGEPAPAGARQLGQDLIRR